MDNNPVISILLNDNGEMRLMEILKVMTLELFSRIGARYVSY